MNEKLELYIDGKWQNGGRAGEDLINPATETVIGKLPHATESDLDQALQALDQAEPLLANERFNRRVVHARLCRARVLREQLGNVPAVLDLAAETARQYHFFGCVRYACGVTEELGLSTPQWP